MDRRLEHIDNVPNCLSDPDQILDELSRR